MVCFKDLRGVESPEKILVGLPDIDSHTPIVIGDYLYQEVNGTLEVIAI